MINLTLFSQILQVIPHDLFRKSVSKFQSDKHSKGIDTRSHLISMIFCHLGKVNSLRDISNGLRSIGGNINHLGVSKVPTKSSLSYINSSRKSDVFQDLYYSLFNYLTTNHSLKRKSVFKLKRKVFLMDSTTIPLSLSLYDWAKFRRAKGAVKMHTLLDFDTALPAYLIISDGKKHDIKAAKETPLPNGSVLVMDMAYIDFKWLFNLDSRGVDFVSRLKTNIKYTVISEREVEPNQTWLLEDKLIELTGFYTKEDYSKPLRMVKIYDDVNELELIFLTNQMSWTASTIAKLYKARWDIEVFFKQIKQHLKIKSFVGTSENAVRIQIWTAMITMLLLAFLKSKSKYPWHFSNLVTFLRLNLFVKINLWAWLNKPFDKPPEQNQEIQYNLL